MLTPSEMIEQNQNLVKQDTKVPDLVEVDTTNLTAQQLDTLHKLDTAGFCAKCGFKKMYWIRYRICVCPNGHDKKNILKLIQERAQQEAIVEATESKEEVVTDSLVS